MEKSDEILLKDTMSHCTCKTNLNPQLIFIQSYNGFTFKTFVGNWTKDGFWISKFRRQFAQLRPDIIARFNFNPELNRTKVEIRYSIGFSSVVFGLMWIFLFSLIFAPFGRMAYAFGLCILFTIYGLLAYMELQLLKYHIRKQLFEKLKIKYMPLE